VIELLNRLWKKLYPSSSSSSDLNDVVSIFTSYWTKSINEIHLGYLLNSSSTNYNYWNTVKTFLSYPANYAADFSIRITCAGVSECGVERIFSHMKWLLGTKRYRLSLKTLQNLLYLKDAKI
jgi:hypothetical protein